MVYPGLYPGTFLELVGYKDVKRSDIKRRPLSDTVLASIEPGTREYRELDGNGLYLRVKPDGQKSWQLRYKNQQGKWTWMGLGGYPQVSGSLARKKAAELRRDISNGEDPVANKKARQAAEREAATNTFEILAREWIAIRTPGWEPGTARRNVGALELHVFPVFGSRPYAEITPKEWMDFLQTLERKGIIEQMGRVRRACKEIYDLARVTGRAIHNPLEGLSRFLQTRPAENYPHVSAKELPDLLRAIRAYPHALDVRLGLRLLMLTGVRPSELREAPWSEFDLPNALWSIPAARMKKRRDHLVPLSTQALEALEELRVLNGHYPLLFPGRSDRKKPRSNMTFNMALRRMGYEGRQTAHGFRHIASTTLRENNFPREHVEAQLAHVEGGVSGVYNKAIYLEQRRAMMQWYADHLENLEKGNVVTVDFQAKG
ncbi:integrase [Pseudomonas psychrotolerans]|uniref:Integrase n=1 Tax=Pseudomonas oryzihabitans TaxID=47885 RepID=A0AAJ2EX16_9PSED|nr:integrase [Pseudomonas psychrotolerans]MDR6355438.1 integrase [Pseudomonas psychrotolerans]